ncbi:putative toxin-antitoxin system toxin component, PIN family [Robbsia betulipollinis]|uniref:putative toxin-antitoxin system toxin component, PIN family n=1 Tax=Robbsia betulipollinis TaxID=2981849 RepID=UPI003D78C5E1
MPGSPAAPSGANPVIDTAAASASTTASTTASALLTVLDSNVWIDILVFDDPDSRPIRTALETGTLAAVIDPACLYELDRVLDYPQFARFALDKAAALATTLRLACLLDAAPPAPPIDGGMAGAAAAMPLPSTPPLPRCSDRDDQKFLELAARSGARWLVTKDKALLKLARRFTRDFACRIDRPGDFVAAALSPPEARPGQPD